MKKTFNHSILALTALIFNLMVQITQGMHSIAPEENTTRTEIMPSSTIAQKPMMLAENKAPSATETKDVESDAGSSSENDSEIPSTASKAEPLKPFKPSEEIAAEQAVDFPVDI